jgi:hypothetical protein
MKIGDQLHVPADLPSMKEHSVFIKEDPLWAQNAYVHGTEEKFFLSFILIELRLSSLTQVLQWLLCLQECNDLKQDWFLNCIISI